MVRRFDFCFRMALLLRQTDEDGREQGEDVCLKECDEQFETVHEDGEENGDDSHRPVYEGPHLCRNEDDACKAEDDGVPGHDVGEQTDHQREGFCEDSHEFDKGNDRDRYFEPCGHIGPEDLLPVGAAAEEVYGDDIFVRRLGKSDKRFWFGPFWIAGNQ